MSANVEVLPALSNDDVGATTGLYQALLMAPIDVAGEPALAEALGKDTPTVYDVFRTAFRHQDEPVRREAAEALARAIEARGAAIALPDDHGSTTKMADVLRNVAGPHAEEFIGVLAMTLHDQRLRAQAIAIQNALLE